MPIGWGVKDLTSIPSSACGWFWASQFPDPCLSFPIDPSGIMIPYHLTKFFEINGWKLQSVIRKCCGELGLVINNKVLCRSFCTIFFLFLRIFQWNKIRSKTLMCFPTLPLFQPYPGWGGKEKIHTHPKKCSCTRHTRFEEMKQRSVFIFALFCQRITVRREGFLRGDFALLLGCTRNVGFTSKHQRAL